MEHCCQFFIITIIIANEDGEQNVPVYSYVLLFITQNMSDVCLCI